LAKGRPGEPGALATKEWDRSTLVSSGWSWIPPDVAEGEADGEV